MPRTMHPWTPCNVIHHNAHRSVLSQGIDHVQRGLFFMESIHVNDIPFLFCLQPIQVVLKGAQLRLNAAIKAKSTPSITGLRQGLWDTLPTFPHSIQTEATYAAVTPSDVPNSRKLPDVDRHRSHLHKANTSFEEVNDLCARSLI